MPPKRRNTKKNEVEDGPPECLNRQSPDVRDRLRAALRAKRQARTPGGQLRQINSALETLNMAPVTNLRAGQKQLGATRKVLARAGAGAGGDEAKEQTINKEFIDESQLPETAASTRPAERAVLRAPTE